MAKRKRHADYEDIMKLNLANCDEYDEMTLGWYRCMLSEAKIGETVSAWSTGQFGTIEQIIRNRKGIPVCFKVRTKEGEVDYISVDRVSSYGYRGYTPDPDQHWYGDTWKESFDDWEDAPENEKDYEDWYGDDWKDADRWDKSPAEEEMT